MPTELALGSGAVAQLLFPDTTSGTVPGTVQEVVPMVSCAAVLAGILRADSSVLPTEIQTEIRRWMVTVDPTQVWGPISGDVVAVVPKGTRAMIGGGTCVEVRSAIHAPILRAESRGPTRGASEQPNRDA